MADTPNRASANEIDRIRDIITGPVVSKMAEQVAELSAALDALRAETARQIADARAESTAADDALRTELRRLADQLGGDKLDRRSLGDELVRLGEQLRAPGK